MTVLAAAPALPVPGGLAAGQAAGLACLFSDPAGARALGAEGRRLAGLLDPAFLAGAGWDPVRLILEVPAGHRLLGWQQCRVAGCLSRGDGPEQVCLGCRLRLAASGLGLDEAGLMPARGWQRPEQCQVPGCPRTWRTPQLPLCRAHLHQQREVLRVGLAEFLAHPGNRAAAAMRAVPGGRLRPGPRRDQRRLLRRACRPVGEGPQGRPGAG